MSDDPALTPRFGLDDLRRCAIALGATAGLPAERASELARLLLWFDTAGAADFGIGTLTDWLDLIDQGRCDGAASASSSGRIVRERPSTAVVDAGHVLAPLALASAAALAGQKARESGVGVVTVLNLDGTHGAGGVAADLAVGPIAAAVRGPGPGLAFAVPTDAGLPAVFDPSLASYPDACPPDWKPGWLQFAAPFLSALAPPPGGWVILALSVVAFEPLEAFHARVGALLPTTETPGVILPSPWQARLRRATDAGITIDPTAWKAIQDRCARASIAEPVPRASS
jgi:LDH2 family malate/lactate/ureidoglycolate dehydrogenase